MAGGGEPEDNAQRFVFRCSRMALARLLDLGSDRHGLGGVDGRGPLGGCL